MTEPPSSHLRGAVDLSRLGKPPLPAPAASAYVTTVTDKTFANLAEQSATVPVLVYLCAAYAPACAEFGPRLDAIANEYAGRFLLAHCDVDESPGVAQAFQVTAVPAVLALIAGRPAPLFQGSATDEQVRDVLDQVLELAAENGVAGVVGGAMAAEPAAPTAEPALPPLPPLHQAAFDAIERGDLVAAAEAYRKALVENPKDADARAGAAQVGLLSRTADVDELSAREAAAADAEAIEAQLVVADLDILAGHVDDAFGRLIDTVRMVAPADRDAIRARLVELFDVVGLDDPRVAAARRELSAALF